MEQQLHQQMNPTRTPLSENMVPVTFNQGHGDTSVQEDPQEHCNDTGATRPFGGLNPMFENMDWNDPTNSNPVMFPPQDLRLNNPFLQDSDQNMSGLMQRPSAYAQQPSGYMQQPSEMQPWEMSLVQAMNNENSHSSRGLVAGNPRDDVSAMQHTGPSGLASSQFGVLVPLGMQHQHHGYGAGHYNFAPNNGLQGIRNPGGTIWSQGAYDMSNASGMNHPGLVNQFDQNNLGASEGIRAFPPQVSLASNEVVMQGNDTEREWQRINLQFENNNPTIHGPQQHQIIDEFDPDYNVFTKVGVPTKDLNDFIPQDVDFNTLVERWDHQDVPLEYFPNLGLGMRQFPMKQPLKAMELALKHPNRWGNKLLVTNGQKRLHVFDIIKKLAYQEQVPLPEITDAVIHEFFVGSPVLANAGIFDKAATPINVDIRMLGKLRITASELIAFFPNHIKWYDCVFRLVQNGWLTRDIADLINYTRSLDVTESRSANTILKNLQNADKDILKERSTGNLARRSFKVTDFTTHGWHVPPRRDTANLTDYFLVDLADGVVNWPTGNGARLVTRAVSHAVSQAHGFVRLSEIEEYIKVYNLRLPLLTPMARMGLKNGENPDSALRRSLCEKIKEGHYTHKQRRQSKQQGNANDSNKD